MNNFCHRINHYLNKLSRVIIIYLLILFSSICDINSKTLNSIPRGKVVDTIKCIYNKSQSYALYLPSYYNTDNKFPIIYIFEPAARGKLPLEKYYKIAEKFGIILACSNNSKNGPYLLNKKAADAIFYDTKTRFTIDTSRMYTMGFSGGARFALRVAFDDRRIKGVIACGAAFPNDVELDEAISFTIVGVVGDLDMNFIELKELEPKLIKYKIKHRIIYYHGDHNWPDTLSINDAFLHLYFDAMKRRLVLNDKRLVKSYLRKQLLQIKNEKSTFKKFLLYKKLVSHVDGLTDVLMLKKNQKELASSYEVQSKLKKEQNLVKIEIDWVIKTSVAFKLLLEHSNSWWKNTMNELRELTNKPETKLLAARMISLVYLKSFENFNYSFKENRNSESVKYMQIAKAAKPESPYPDYYLAKVYIKQKKNGKALKMLKSSIDKGFKNYKYIVNDDSFRELSESEKFLKVIAPIKKD